MIAFDCTDDLFWTYTFLYEEFHESIQKGQKGSVLVKIGLRTGICRFPEKNASNDGWVYDFYEVRKFLFHDSNPHFGWVIINITSFRGMTNKILKFLMKSANQNASFRTCENLDLEKEILKKNMKPENNNRPNPR